MSLQICWKCSRSIEPLERKEKDKKSKKSWTILYCPFERCKANLDIYPSVNVKMWNSAKGFFEDETEHDPFA
jgi:hypothetical protein